MHKKYVVLGASIVFVFTLGVTSLILKVQAKSDSAKAVDLSNPDVAAIVRVAKDFSEAYESGDVGRIIEFYSPEVVYMSPGMPNHEGRAVIRELYQQLFSRYHGRVEVQIEEVKVYGEMAFDRARFSSRLTPKAGGETVVSKGRLLEVLRKENGNWKSFRVMVNTEE